MLGSIAVLPLTNLSGDPEQDYFADGMTEALITDLAQIRALKVISRTSVMQYKHVEKSLPEIAKDLNVEALVEGSVMRSENRIPISAQLIEAATDRHLGAKSYERDLRDILSLQREVAAAIAHEIKIKLTTQEIQCLEINSVVNPKAHDAYLKGRYFLNEGNVESTWKAVDFFKQSIREDPEYSPAYAGLVDTYLCLDDYDYLPEKEAQQLAQNAIDKALDLEGQIAEVYSSLAHLSIHTWDWETARTACLQGLELTDMP